MIQRHFYKLIAAVFLWFLTLCCLGIWWGRLALSQAKRIAELEQRLGLSASLTEHHWHRTQRMLYWESSTFFCLLLASTLLLVWLYWQETRRSKSLQAFFAAVTHELRTPLTSIRLQAESIAEASQKDTTELNLIHRLLEDSLRLEAQVERTLELARVEGGGPVYTQSLLIKPWLDRFLARWEAEYENRIRIHTEIADVTVQADPMALQMIFKNLLENAIKHSKRTPVHVEITVIVKSTGGVLLSLKDDGTGYHGTTPQTLGELFQRGTASQGTGVGLYLVQSLMKKMRGQVHFILRNSTGFEVALWLPEGQAEDRMEN